MFEQNYQSAMEKLSVNETWRAETLRQMQAAELEPQQGKKPPVRFTRRMALICAAIAIVLLVPLRFVQDDFSMDMALFSGGANSTTAQVTDEGKSTASAAAGAAPYAAMPSEAAAPEAAIEGQEQEDRAKNSSPNSDQGVLVQRSDDGFFIVAQGVSTYYAITEYTVFEHADAIELEGCSVIVTYSLAEDGTRQAMNITIDSASASQSAP